VPWWQSDDFKPQQRASVTYVYKGKDVFLWLWLRVFSDAVLCNSSLPDCGNSPCPPLLSPGFITASRTLQKHALEIVTVTSSRSVNQEASFCFNEEQLKREAACCSLGTRPSENRKEGLGDRLRWKCTKQNV